MKFDEKKIQNSRQFETLIHEREIKRILQKNIYFLYTHNKNYTKSQYYAVEELKIIIDNIKE